MQVLILVTLGILGVESGLGKYLMIETLPNREKFVVETDSTSEVSSNQDVVSAEDIKPLTENLEKADGSDYSQLGMERFDAMEDVTFQAEKEPYAEKEEPQEETTSNPYAESEEEPEEEKTSEDKGENAGKCVTIEGPKPGHKCVFPFKLASRNKTYHGCTRDLHKGQANEFWCSTKVNSKGEHLSGNWGECSKKCPGVQKLEREFCKTKNGFECFFPYTLEGFTYKGCVTRDGVRQCLGKNLNNSNEFDWGECPSSCPKDEMLTTKALTFKEIKDKLMTEDVVFSYIPRKGSCQKDLLKKFKAEKSSLGPEFEKIKTLEDAISKVCSLADYCKDASGNPLCGQYQVYKRFNKIKDEETGTKHKSKSDCRIACSNPESTSSR